MEITKTKSKRASKQKPEFELFKVGKAIKELRNEKKLSLSQLSEKAFGNTHKATDISKVERGLLPFIPFTFVVKVLKALDVEIF